MFEIRLLDGRTIRPDYTGLKIVEKLARGEKLMPGSLVAIEAEVELPNVDDTLSPENPTSPYAGAIGAGCILRVDDLELIVTDWEAPLATPRARIRAVDAATHRFE
ncbi:MAG: hypothetical protein IMX05_01500, partial [Hydrogenibacillus schlegelii]|nr:hypothetical protein [Hydrogenibacillus schlegelii]